MTVLSARDKQTERQRENITYFDIRKGYFISFIIHFEFLAKFHRSDFYI